MNPQQYNLAKLAYTPAELIALGIIGSRTQLYRFVNEKRLKLTKRGSRTIFLANDIANFLASLQDVAVPEVP